MITYTSYITLMILGKSPRWIPHLVNSDWADSHPENIHLVKFPPGEFSLSKSPPGEFHTDELLVTFYTVNFILQNSFPVKRWKEIRN